MFIVELQLMSEGSLHFLMIRLTSLLPNPFAFMCVYECVYMRVCVCMCVCYAYSPH